MTHNLPQNERVRESAREIINKCKDSCYSIGRKAGNEREGDYGSWKDWEDVIYQAIELARIEERERMERDIMIATTDAENQHCPAHLPCKSCVVYVRQKFLEALTPQDNK